jgi:excisionase family DNA binding protein
MSDREIEPLLTPEQTAKLLGLKVETLNTWRSTNRYSLPFIRVGRVIRYRVADIEQFLESRRVSNAE